MKTYRMSFAASLSHKPEYPERTAKRPSGDHDVEFGVWTNRPAMLKTIELQGMSAPKARNWKAVIKDGAS